METHSVMCCSCKRSAALLQRFLVSLLFFRTNTARSIEKIETRCDVTLRLPAPSSCAALRVMLCACVCAIVEAGTVSRSLSLTHSLSLPVNVFSCERQFVSQSPSLLRSLTTRYSFLMSAALLHASGANTSFSLSSPAAATVLSRCSNTHTHMRYDCRFQNRLRVLSARVSRDTHTGTRGKATEQADTEANVQRQMRNKSKRKRTTM